MICKENQLTGVYMMGTLVVNFSDNKNNTQAHLIRFRVK